MSQYGWTTCPPAIQAQLAGLREMIEALLGRNLAGIYLHGSLAMGCFNAQRSDLDLLVVVERALPRDTRCGLVRTLLARSLQPAPIEVSFLSRGDLQPWRYPTPFQLHFSEQWRQRLQEQTAGTAWLAWPEEAGTDPDLAAHIAVTRGRGVALCGAPIAEVFPEVPAADYIASIVADSEAAAAAVAANPVAVVLNLCRVYCAVEEQRVRSKDEGGAWALRLLSPALAATVEQALAAYRGEPVQPQWDDRALRLFVHELQSRIHARLAVGPETRQGQQLTFRDS